MSFKAIQKHWYDLLALDGFEDAEDPEIGHFEYQNGKPLTAEQGARPLKKWTGTSSVMNKANHKIIDLIDLHVHQPEGSPMISSFPEPHFNQKEAFMNYAEFAKACDFLCKHGNSKLTPKLITLIWQAHCEGETERQIEERFRISDTKVHHVITKLTEWMNVMGAGSDQQPAYEDEPQHKVILRDYHHDKDAPLIFASWRNSLWYDQDRDDAISNEFYRKANKDIKHLLRMPLTNVTIACLESDHDQIIGYSVMTKANVEWVYVKIDYRKQGIAKLLCKGMKSISTPYTVIGQSIARKKKLKVQGE